MLDSSAQDEQRVKKRQVMALLSPFRQSDDVVASLLLVFDLAGFVICSHLLVRYASSWTAPLLSLAIALFITRLFIVGHDCGHGSFFSTSKANSVLGRLAMLPSLVPYSPWGVGHNTLHHGYTGLRSRDFTWQPLAVREYLALPWYERMIYRVCRTLPGVALYWMRELWWKKLMAPDAEKYPSLNRPVHKQDRGLVLAFLMVWVAAVYLDRGAALPLGTVMFWAILAPSVLWSWTMGFTIYIHHTGPEAIWFADRKQWAFFESQFRLTPNLFPPKILSICLHNIYCHLPHHLDISVPLYRLEAAMEALKIRFAPDIVEKPLTLQAIRETFRKCQLFDFENNAWVTFRSLTETQAIR